MMMASPYNTSLLIDDTWLEFNSGCSQMLSYVSPDEICPMEHLHSQPLTTIYQQQQPHYQNQNQNQQFSQQQAQQVHQPLQNQQAQPLQQLQQPVNLIATYEGNEDYVRKQYQGEQAVIRVSPQLDLINQSFSGELPLVQSPTDELQANQSSEVLNDDQNSLPPPPLLVPRDEDKHMSIQERLDYERALSQQRQEQLRQQLEREPLKLPSSITKKSAGRKMTGRERQIELERTEAELLNQRDRYMELISKLEAKCQRLRELLGDIVINSPEYNDKFASCLESDDLFIDSHINGLAD